MLLPTLSRLARDFSYNHRLTHIPFSSLFPRIYQIEITNFCNLRCIMCPLPEMKREKGFMSFDLFRDIIQQAKGNRNQLIILHHFGEPLLHPEIGKFINYAEGFMRTMISTNAVFLKNDKAIDIIRSGLSYITISINGNSSQTYSDVTQRGNLDLVRENVISFLKLKRRYCSDKPQINLQIVRMNETLDQIDQFVEFWRDQGADQVHIKSFDTWAGQIEDIQGLANPSDRIRSSNLERFPCKYLWDNVVVLWDGRVVPCCRDYDGKVILGDLKKQSLKEIWTGPPLRGLRAQHVDGDYSSIELCSKCVEWVGYASGRLYPLDSLFYAFRKPVENRKIRDVILNLVFLGETDHRLITKTSIPKDTGVNYGL